MINKDENKQLADTGEQSESDPRAAKSPPVQLLLIITIVLIVVATAGSIYLFNRLQTAETRLVEIYDQVTSQAEVHASANTELKSSIKKLDEQQDVLADTISLIYQQQPGSNKDWALAEIEYLLIIATHRLLLEGDINTALVAMEAADRRLRDLRDPGLLPVRDQLAEDINNLRNVNATDISGLALYMADLVERAQSLPLKSEEASSSQPDEPIIMSEKQTGWRNLFGAIWKELKSIVVIKHKGNSGQEILLPDQEFFLIQNLRLEIGSARHSILRRDTENLQTSILIINNWLMKYFNTNDTAVANIMEALDKISRVDLNPEIPDITSSLETLRAYRRASESGEKVFEDESEKPAS